MTQSAPDSAAKFDTSRASEYARQSRIALAGYDACHELSACMLAASLGQSRSAHVLVVGAGGTAQEIIAMAALEPDWKFTAVDPTEPMLATAKEHLHANDLLHRTQIHLGHVEDLPADASFDAATLIGVLHHLRGDEAKKQILQSIQVRLKPGAPLIAVGNHYTYASQPSLLQAWSQRWRQQGATADEVQVKLGKILQGADPPHSEAAVQALLHDAGFGRRPGFSAVCSGALG